MKLIIAGGRNYQFTGADYAALDALHLLRGVSEVVSGCASGADKCGEEWAKRNNIPVKPFPANWKAFGRSAGPIRNRQMAEYADALALFPGGKGTANMREMAVLNYLEIFEPSDNHD